jgi:hypothetical protein
MGDDAEPIDLQLDRASAEALMATLTIFLLKGEGEDSPKATGRNSRERPPLGAIRQRLKARLARVPRRFALAVGGHL